ncbi:DUF5381 family protein, partial [Bacillus altitudinis]|uniref:DUF5381 family protein n=1 Tax=Bacillus altitudinis TaxID=293387 RepID=UPI003B51D8A7
MPFQHIQSIHIRTHPYTITGFLFIHLLIPKIHPKFINIPPYTILHQQLFQQTLKQHIYPYLHHTPQHNSKHHHAHAEKHNQYIFSPSFHE